MHCPSCHQENPEGARFCNTCGASLQGETLTSLESLQRYLPKDLADKLRALGGQLHSERRHVTVVFADLSGFTTLSEKLDPEEVTQLINACFQTLVEAIFQYEGTIDKFIGDEIMALFGAPIAHENDPERAIRAALEMQERLRQFNQTLTTPLPKPLTLHVGINSGEVIAGNVGSDLRMDYSVLGDTVNLAARLEGASPAGQIWVSERTYLLTRHLFEFKALKPFKVQGKVKKVLAYQVLGVKVVPERGRGVAEGYGPLVGRSEELAQLREVVAQVQRGQGQVLGVVGEAGIGKSRLVYELQQLATSFTQASAACVSYEVPASYQVFADLLRSLFSLAPDDPEEVLRRKLEAWSLAHGVDRETHLPFLGSLLGLRDERLLYLSDAARLQGVKAALLAVFQALTADRPLLLIFEDLHWVDPLSRRLLEELVPEVGTLPLLLCGVYRPEFQPAWKDPCQFLPVGPLTPEQTVELSQTLLHLDLPPELEQLITSRAEGNPFFAEELLKALIDAGAILKTRSGYALKQDLSQLRLPDTMQGVILARLDRLEAQARDTLQYAAVIGRRFPQALLQAVSPRAQQVEQDLQQLQSLELVYQHRILPDLEYIFKHFVIREVAYHNILLRRRKGLHLEIARSIEQLYRERLEDYYEALAHHFEAGEDWQKAADYYGRAGTRAREVHADEGAEAFLEKREQAVQKVFEQQQGKPRALYLYIGIWILILADQIWCLTGWHPWGPPPNPQAWLFAGISILFLAYLLWKLVRGVAKAVTIYTDRLVLRSSQGIDQVLFESIESVSWGQRGWRPQLRGLAKKLWSFRKARSFYGTSGFWSGYREIYFGPRRSLEILARDAPPLVIASASSGDLYRELKLALGRWAAAQGRKLADLFSGSSSRFEEQYHFALWQVEGALLGPITYDQVIEGMEKGQLRGQDEMVFKGGPANEEIRISLDQASREDRRLWAALHPLRYSLTAWFGNPVFWFFAILSAVVLGGEAISLLFPPPPVVVNELGEEMYFSGTIYMVGPISIIVWLFVLPELFHLRFGFLEWSKRLLLSRWQRIGLRLLTGFALLALIPGLLWLVEITGAGVIEVELPAE